MCACILCVCDVLQELPATHQEEQEQLKREFHRAAGEAEIDEEDGGLLTLRRKDKEEL